MRAGLPESQLPQAGFSEVLAAFHSHPVAAVGSNCLGQCGNGPMVMVLPDPFGTVASSLLKCLRL